MKVLLADYWNSAGSRYTAQLAKQLAEHRELQVYYLSRFGMDPDLDRIVTSSRVKIINQFARQRRYFRIPWADLIRWGAYNQFVLLYNIILLKPDIVHLQHFAYWTEPISLLLRKLLIQRKYKLIRTVHDVTPHRWLFNNGLMNSFERSWLKWVLNKHDHLIVHTRHGEELLRKNHNLSSITYIHFGMEKPRPINKYKKPVLLLLGNLRPDKNLDLAIKAFQQLDRKIRMNWHLCIRGKSSYSTQEYRTKIEKLIKIDPLGIDYTNHYVSEKEFDELINESAYVLLLYTNFQSQSGLAARSIYLSTPLICTSEPAFIETFDEKTAIFCQPDVQSVANTFKKVCREGIPGSLSRALNIYNVYHKFSWEKSIEKHITLYKSIIDH